MMIYLLNMVMCHSYVKTWALGDEHPQVATKVGPQPVDVWSKPTHTDMIYTHTYIYTYIHTYK